jgi:hypothetical protein
MPTPKTFHHPPKLPYKGLTIVLSNPSRFDFRQLLSGNAGTWFCDTALRGIGLNRFQCDIRTMDVEDPLLADTKVVLCLGQAAQQKLFSPEHSLSEQRGSPHIKNGIVYLSSFFPQDCYDLQNYEARLNPHHSGPREDSETADDDEAKGHKGSTRRQNYKFWTECDVKKSGRILRQGLSRTTQPSPILYPSGSQVVSLLQSTKGTTLYLDIETTFDRTLTCIGFCFEGAGEPAYVIPFRRYDFTLAYEPTVMSQILRALSVAMRDNLVVSHNGHGFDWLVLAHNYRVPFGKRLYDTMISHNRCYPEAEKSLGHCLSLWTDEAYHKDEGVFDPRSMDQERQLWLYNAKDVYAMRVLKSAFDRECANDSGLKASIEQGQSMIYPYLVATLKGMKMDEETLRNIVSENDRYMMQLQRIAKMLVGDVAFDLVKGKSDASLMSSNKQAAKYFYTMLGYKVPYKTLSGEPACDAGAMLKMKLALAKSGIENPVIDLRLRYAGVKKETSFLAGINSWPEKAYV